VPAPAHLRGCLQRIHVEKSMHVVRADITTRRCCLRMIPCLRAGSGGWDVETLYGNCIIINVVFGGGR